MKFKFKTKLVLGSLLIFSGTIVSQPKLVEKVQKKTEQVNIPFDKYVLSNGLQIVIHEDHSDPICHVDVTYHVGSAREEIGRSGFAHFFEHMMFQGSDNVGDEQHFKIVTEAGGTMNGTTNTDRTNYFETLPNNQLEVAMWLESDRMGFLLDAVTQKKFEVQRATVKNERGQRYDNAPYGLVYEKTSRALFPYGHPYSWTTIGDIEDLNRVNVEDLKKFFMRWYGPNNATLTVAGDVDPVKVLELANKYFGSIPRGPEVAGQKKETIALDKNRYISYEDNIKFPMIQVTFPGTYARSEDEPALDALSDILSGSKNSIFYQNFIKSQKAISADFYNYSMELGGMVFASIKANPDTKLSEMYDLINKSFSEFEKRGVTDEDVKNFIAKTETQYINTLNTVAGKASMLAAYNTYTGSPDYISKELESYKKITKEDVIRVYNQYIKGKFAVILSVYPKSKKDLIVAEDNYLPKATNPDDADHKEYQNLSYNKPKDTFDRSKKPEAKEAPMFKIPEIWTEDLSNGLKVLGTANNELPTTTLQFSINCGHRFESKDKSGISVLLASMLDESTASYTSEDINTKLDKLGSEISIYSGSQELTINVFSLTKNLDETLKLLEEKMFKPKFDEKDFERVKNEQIQSILNQSIQPTVIANNIYNKLLYGENSVMGMPNSGTKTTVESITLDELKKYYETYWSSNLSTLIVVSDLNKATCLNKFSFLNNWKNKNVKMPAEEVKPSIDKTKIYLVNKDKAAQSEIRIGYLAMPFDAVGEYYKSTVMNYILGGAFNSRINLNLREDKGYTYGARSGFQGSKYIGPFTAGAGVRGDATDSSLVEFFKEIKKYKENGIEEEELKFTKSSLTQSEALKYESPFQKAGFLKRISDYNLSREFSVEQAKALKEISKAEINKLAAEKLPYDKMVVTIVGDKSKIYLPLSKLGYEIIELDSDGNKLN
jgi:zinc protease